MTSFYRSMFFLLFTLGLLLLVRPQPLFAQNTPATASTTGDLADKVDAAIQSARGGNLNPIYALPNQKGQIFPLLDKYAHDPDPRVYRVLEFFAQGSHSAQSVKIFSDLIGQGREQSVDDLYRLYSPGELQQWGGDRLKQNLLAVLQKTQIGEDEFGGGNPTSIKAILLLLCFPVDANVHSFLENLRATGLTYTLNAYVQGQTVKRVFTKRASLLNSDVVDLALPVDIALSEQGNMLAMMRVKQSIKEGDVNGTLVFILETTRFLKQRPILRALVELVKDKRFTQLPTKQIIMPDAVIQNGKSIIPTATQTNPQPATFRVCDLALAGLVENTGVDVGIPDLMLAIRKNPRTFPKRLYTDDELQRAYLLLKRALSPGPVLFHVKTVQPKRSFHI